MEKILVRNRKEFDDFVDFQIRMRVDATNERAYPPESYPCVIAYTQLDIDSMRWAEDLLTSYIYPSDFEIEENQNG